MINLLSLKSLYEHSHNIHHYDHLTMKRLNQYQRSDSSYDRLNHANYNSLDLVNEINYNIYLSNIIWSVKRLHVYYQLCNKQLINGKLHMIRDLKHTN